MSVQIQTKQLLGTRVDQEELQTLRARYERSKAFFLLNTTSASVYILERNSYCKRQIN